MKKPSHYLTILVLTILCFSCNEEVPLRTKKNYSSKSPEARYLGECQALYSSGGVVQFGKLPKVLVSIEYDSNKVMLNKTAVGSGIRENIFYNEDGNITKLESFVNDVPEQLFTATYNEYGDVTEESEMKQYNGNVEKISTRVHYIYGSNPKEYVASIFVEKDTLIKVTQIQLGDTIIRTSENSLFEESYISKEEVEVYEDDLLVRKTVRSLVPDLQAMTVDSGTTTTIYKYNEDRKLVSERTSYPANLRKSETIISYSYGHGLLYGKNNGRQEREKYRLFKLEYD